ncbi:phospholipid carrier-dependent glycosyltransferase [bacterium SCSIO 12696]|nr:phospholipid carrier-dependent glycosyltransferase [bacterium SCSIO 12696]
MLSRYFQHIADAPPKRIFLFLFILAFALRLIGVNYGYWHGDERVNEAAKVLTGQLIPGQHFYPPLLNYINAVFLGILYAIGRIIPIWHSTAEFRAQYFADPTAFYLTARTVTAAMGAIIAPLFYIFAKSLRLSSKSCLTIGILGLLIPAMIFLCHISKSDIPLSVCSVLVFIAILKKNDNPHSLKYDFFLGVSIALAVSFKHSYVIMAAPLMLGHLILFSLRYGAQLGVKTILISSAFMLPIWCVLNIGILLDIQNFIDYQKIQAQMSVRSEEGLVSSFSAWAYWAGHPSYGINWIATVLFLLTPFYINSKYCAIGSKSLINLFWTATFISMIVVIVISGSRQHSGLWIPYFTCMQLFAALVITDAIFHKDRPKRTKLACGLTLAAFLSVSLLGSIEIWRQALSKPIADEVADFINANYKDRKILTSFEIRLPKQKIAQTDERRRHQNLADKYGITLPEQAQERLIESSDPDAVYYYGLPGVMFGLEKADDDSLEGAVKPFAWPLQDEEWHLKYWTSKGFSILVVSNYEYFLNESGVPQFFNFYSELEKNCSKAVSFDARKPFFLEPNVTVFDCTDHKDLSALKEGQK